MTVKELIEALKTKPQDAIVLSIGGTEYDAAFGVYWEVGTVSLVKAQEGGDGYHIEGGDRFDEDEPTFDAVLI